MLRGQHTDLQFAESRKGIIAQRDDVVVFQVEFGETGTGGEGAIQEGRQQVRPQSEDIEGGQDRSDAGDHLWNLSSQKVRKLFYSRMRKSNVERKFSGDQLALMLMNWYLFFKNGFFDRHLVPCEVDLIDLSQKLEGGPGQAGEQVHRKQQNLKTERTEGENI